MSERPVLSAPYPVADERKPVLAGAFGLDHLPPSASAREFLRGQLPAIYQDPPDGFPMRFLEALEHVLDPRVAVIDCRAAYIDCELAPEDMVHEMAVWLGIEPDELPPASIRRVLANANQLASWRGTRKGLELMLTCCFPDLHLKLEDSGGMLTPAMPDHSDAARMVVRCRERLDDERLAQLVRVIDRQLALHVGLEIRDHDLSVPDGMVHEVASWLRLEVEQLPAETLRRVLANAGRLAASRGTREGLELALSCCFPHLRFEVQDAGESRGPRLVVKCREMLEPRQQAAVERVISHQFPLHGALEVKDGDPSVPREAKR